MGTSQVLFIRTSEVDDVAWFSHAGDVSRTDDHGTRRYNFYEATGGRGTIIMDSLSQFLKDNE